MGLKKMLQEQYDTSAISAQVLPFNTYNQEGELYEARQLVVLDAEDRFMFVISYTEADKYIDELGYINYEKIFQDYIFTEEQWAQLKIKTEEDAPQLDVAQEKELVATK
jgi:hypothetical protein